jgi:hypothetical protein
MAEAATGRTLATEIVQHLTDRGPVGGIRDSGITYLAMMGLGVDRIMRRAGHDMVQTSMGYVKQAEDLSGELGAPFDHCRRAWWVPRGFG